MSFSDTRLRVFHAVAKHLSFTRAAEELYLTQPAVTFQIRQLEEHFNTRLFDRHHNRISLTDAGEAVFNYAERILDLYREAEKAISEMTGETRGIIKLGASTTIGEYLLPPILSGYHENFPKVQIRLSIDNTRLVVRKLEDATIDMGMVEGPVSNKNISTAPCLEDELVVVIPPGHPFASLDEIPLAKLKEYPFVSREEGSGTRMVISEHLSKAGLSYDHLDMILELGTTESVKAAVEGGVGFSILSSVALRKELQLQSLVVRRVKGIRFRRLLNFIYQKQKFRSKAVEEFLNYAKLRCQSLHANV
ncbi:MAG: LysR family transcriptional regulator [Magnetococcales bacterium]|nr:LysR family transcriptional regulator [Magnetococcales bacterium]MBF0418795.1 LysR family transcriptional regulator [Magnetococcales bacterium]MBF0434529.1 LysR family transcriptional regulator [Magnetococcales bacterium]